MGLTKVYILCIPCTHPACLQATQYLRNRCHAFLLTQLPQELHAAAEAAAGRGQLAGGEQSTDGGETDMELDGQPGARSPSPARWGIAPFFVEQQQRGGGGSGGAAFNFQAPTTGRNALRVLRALQVGIPPPLQPANTGDMRARSWPLPAAWPTVLLALLRSSPAAAAQADLAGRQPRGGQDLARCRHGQGSG